MERLTTKRKDGRWAIRNDDGATPKEQINKIPRAIDRLAAYEDTGLEPEEIDSVFIHGVIEENQRLKELAQAEKDERLVVLPCKIGDELWTVVTKRPKISCPEFSFVKRSLLTWNNLRHVLQGFGKTVFLTREEAEAALKKREEAE